MTLEEERDALARQTLADGIKIAEQELEIRRLTKLATDRHYFMDAYRNMLGPIGLKVAKMWDEKRVQRVHFSWGEKAFDMTGEERAQHILDWEAAPRTIVDSVDS